MFTQITGSSRAGSDLDLIVNSALSRFHVPITLDPHKPSGFNVLCEKPFAATVAEVDCLTDAAKKTGKLLAVYQQSRYAPYFSKG